MDRGQRFPWAGRFFHAIGAIGTFVPFNLGARARGLLRHFALTVAALAASTLGFAAETLIPDLTFGGTVLGIPGRTFANTQGASPRWSAGRLDASGKLVVVGTECPNGGSCTNGRNLVLARLDTNGQIDPTFNAGGVRPGTLLFTFGMLNASAGIYAEVADMVIDSVGRIVIGGVVAQNETFVARFLPSGALDTTFAPGATIPGVYRRNFRPGNALQTITVDVSDRPLIAGHANGVPFVSRLTLTGGTDFSFNATGPNPGVLQFTSTLVPGFLFGSATSISMDYSQRIVVAGLQNDQNYFAVSAVNRGNGYGYGIGSPFVARLTANGTLDPAFGTGTWPGISKLAGFNNPGNRHFKGRVAHIIDGNSRIVIGGPAQFVGQAGPVAFRLDANGIEDPTAYTYSPNWPIMGTPYSPVSSIAPLGAAEYSSGQMGIDGSGNVYIGGTYSLGTNPNNDSRFFLFRANANLQPDSAFAPDIAGNPPARGMRSFDATDGPYSWINPSGSPPDVPMFLLDAAHGVAYMSGPGKLLQGEGPVLRVTTAAGALDPTYGIGGIATTGVDQGFAEVTNRALVTLADGRSIVVGRHTVAHTAYGGTSLSLTRFTASGVLDPTFAPLGDPPGHLLWAPSLDNATKFRMQESGVTSAMLDADGKIVVAFTAWVLTNGSQITTVIARFLDNGAIDTTFNPTGTVPGMLARHIGDPVATMTGYQVKQDLQKRYYLVGTTASAIPVNFNTVGFVARYLNDGTPDATFNDGIYPFVYVRYGNGSSMTTAEAIDVAADGTVLVAGEVLDSGSFGPLGGGVARYLSNGAPDTSFNAGGPRQGALFLPSPVTSVTGLLTLNDGRIITSHRAITGDPTFGPYHEFRRIKADGTLDSSYNSGQGKLVPTSTCFNNWFVSARLSNGSSYLLCSGYAQYGSGSAIITPPVVMRIDATGERFASFASNGELVLASTLATGGILARGLSVDASGAVVIAGQVITGFTNNPYLAKAATYIARFLPITISTPPVLQGISSRKAHGSAGTFDLPLVATPLNPTTEPRQGSTATLVFTFDKPISSATATVAESTAVAAAPTFNGNEVIIGLSGVSNQQYVTVTLTNVASTDGGTGGSGSVRLGFLLGDVNASRVVSLADVGLVNASLAQSVTASNFLKDVNANGTLTLADKGITNANLTKALPPP